MGLSSPRRAQQAGPAHDRTLVSAIVEMGFDIAKRLGASSPGGSHRINSYFGPIHCSMDHVSGQEKLQRRRKNDPITLPTNHRFIAVPIRCHLRRALPEHNFSFFASILNVIVRIPSFRYITGPDTSSGTDVRATRSCQARQGRGTLRYTLEHGSDSVIGRHGLPEANRVRTSSILPSRQARVFFERTGWNAAAQKLRPR